MSKKQLVTIIIPAFNEEKVIGRLLQSIKEQTYKQIETIVVDDASTDGTVQLSKKYTRYVFTQKHAERSVQRNFGAKKAKGNYLFFIDADMELTKHVVEECVEVVRKDHETGAIVIPEDSVATNFWEKVKAYERSFYNEAGDDTTDAARFFPKEVFEKVGGYDESITGPEDWDLPDRIVELGYKKARVKSLIYHYERVTNPFKLAKKKYYYGLRAHTYMAKHNVSAISAKTIYFLRPVFYKNWKKLLAHPFVSFSMIFMLFVEQAGGGLGYFVGRIRK